MSQIAQSMPQVLSCEIYRIRVFKMVNFTLRKVRITLWAGAPKGPIVLGRQMFSGNYIKCIFVWYVYIVLLSLKRICV